jgi:Zn-dependent protease with chaperone function
MKFIFGGVFLVVVAVILASAGLQAEAETGVAAFDVEAATQSYLDRLKPEERAASDAYFEGGYWLILWNLLMGLLIAWLLLNYGISSRMRDLGERMTRFRFMWTVSYIFQYTLIVFVLSLPLWIYQDFIREHQYGLSNLTITGWFGELMIGLGVELVFSCLGLALIYFVIRKAQATWPVWGFVAGVLMLAFLVLVTPVFISPLFNDYQSLQKGPLREEILSLARANGVPAEDVYQFDASRQSNRISANVSGLLGTTRISLNDNLLDRASDEGIQAVMAHEIGHYVLNHGPKMILSLGLLLAGGFVFVAWAFDRVNKPSWGIRGVGDIAGLPLLIALLSIYFFVMTPIYNSIIRINEIEADIFGLNAARQPDANAEALLGLAEYRKMKPTYWEEIIFYDHPSGYNRIYMSMQWKKENLGSLAED